MTSTLLLLILGLALVGNTVVGGLPDKVLHAGSKKAVAAGTGTTTGNTPGLGVMGPDTAAIAGTAAGPGLGQP